MQCGLVIASLRTPGNNMKYIELFTSSLGNMTDALMRAQQFSRGNACLSLDSIASSRNSFFSVVIFLYAWSAFEEATSE